MMNNPLAYAACAFYCHVVCVCVCMCVMCMLSTDPLVLICPMFNPTSVCLKYTHTTLQVHTSFPLS